MSSFSTTTTTKNKDEGTNEENNDEEPSSVKVFIRPLEVTVPADFISTNSNHQKTDSSSENTNKTYWSTMTSRIETETSVKRWSIPPVTTVEGSPPKPEDNPQTKQGRELEGRSIGITPNYKIGEGQPKSELNLGKSGYLPNGSGDYKVSTLQEMYKQTIIKPSVVSNANMPHLSTRIPDVRPNIAGDFPSEHSKRSQVKLEPLEQRRFRSTESRPVSTSNYLTESVQRHRDMEASRLRDYLKAKEGEANQPWNKPGWPGPRKTADDESLRELETIKQRVETLKRDANKPPAVVPPLRAKTPPPPQPPPPPRRALWEEQERYTSAPNLHSAVIRIQRLQDDKPRSIMKRRELESREQLLYPTHDTQVVKSYVRAKPTVTETVQRFEETRRTEEVERRVQRREKKERRSRHHSSSRHQQSGWEGQTGGYHEFRHGSLPRRQVIREADRAMTEAEMDKVVREAYAAADEARKSSRNRSSSLSRGGYLPGGQESYYRHETTRRQQHNNYDDNFNRGIAHARYGSLSDSLRRGELKYIPNGEVRESFYGGSHAGQQQQHHHHQQQQQQQQQQRMHKSYSTRDVFNGGNQYDDRRSVSSFRRGSQQQVSPFVEFPPTLPRRGDYRDEGHFRPVSKSRSYADWDDAGRAGFGREVRKYDDDMSRLEAEFRDSLLMPLPGGNMNERDHRTEQLPGGYETFDKDRRATSGRRVGRDGKPVDFHEAAQEYNYKREQTFDDRRRPQPAQY